MFKLFNCQSPFWLTNAAGRGHGGHWWAGVQAASSCGQKQCRDSQSPGPLQIEIAEDRKEPELGASTGRRLGRKAAGRKAGREGSSEGWLLRGFAVPFSTVQEQSSVPLLLSHPPHYPAPTVSHSVSVLSSLPSHSDPVQQARWVPSQSSWLLPLPWPLSHLPLPFTLEAQPSGQGTPSLTVGLTGQLYSIGTKSHSSRGCWAAGRLGFGFYLSVSSAAKWVSREQDHDSDDFDP